MMRLRRGFSALGGLVSLVIGCSQGGSSAPAESPTATAPSVEESDSVLTENEPHGPRLVLWITVDQMRGDYLKKYAKHFGDGGFKRLLASGRHFENAHYAHAITETAPGHATLFTGTSPKTHGIIGNSWLLPSGVETQSVEDPSVHTTGPGKSEADGGRSPLHLLSLTVGDELIRQTHGKSKVIALSSKDRAAILPAGKMGTAFWLGSEGFVSSTDYAEDAPAWLYEHHKNSPPATYLDEPWSLLLSEGEYLNSATKSDWAPGSWSPSFPHELSKDADPVKALIVSPYGDEAVIDAALAAAAGESLGADDATDLLSVSLSSTDLIGHLYGPESREMEDQLVRLDRQLDRFFSEMEKLVPAENTLVVLSADHGGSESAEYHSKAGRDGRRLREEEIANAAKAALQKKYSHTDYFLGVESPYVFLKRDRIAEKKASLEEVRRVVVEAVTALGSVHSAHSLGAVTAEGPLKAQLEEAMHAERSGDIYVVPQEHTLFLQRDAMKATHGSPWSYDTHVPIIVAGPGVKAGTDGERVDVRSLAPTVCSLVDMKPPPQALQPLLKVAP